MVPLNYAYCIGDLIVNCLLVGSQDEVVVVLAKALTNSQ